MPRTLISALPEQLGQRVTICGFVDTLRLQRRMQFVLIRDHTGLVQITHRRTDPAGESGPADPIEAAFRAVTPESAVKITGLVVANPIVKLGGLEILPDDVEIVSLAEAGLPIDEHTSIDQRLDWRFLDLSRPVQRLVFDVQTTVEQAMRQVAGAEGFTELHTPKLMGTASESGSEVFAVGYFDGPHTWPSPRSSTSRWRSAAAFVFVTRYAIGLRPFYHLRPDDDPTVTASFDLLWRGLEITTGAQREHRHDRLTARAREKGLALEPLTSYLDCFRFGAPPHGGFGLGLNRLLMVLLGLSSIREATFLFRGPNRLTP